MKPSLFIQTLDLFKCYLANVQFWTVQLTRPDRRCFEMSSIRLWLRVNREGVRLYASRLITIASVL